VAPTITTSLAAAGSSALPLLQQQPPPLPPPSILTPPPGRRGRFRGPSLLPAPATAAAAMGERTTVPILVASPLI